MQKTSGNKNAIFQIKLAKIDTVQGLGGGG